MLRTKNVIILLICLFIFGITVNDISSKAPRNKYMLIIFEDRVDYAGLNYEVMEMVFYDGFFCYITSCKRRVISFNIVDLYVVLEKINRKIANIKTVMHNHFNNSEFSEADMLFLSNLRTFGFKGEFLLYCQGQIYRSKE